MYDLKHRWIDEASTGCKDNDPDKYEWKIIVTEERFRCEGDGGSCNYESNSYAENDGVLESVKDEDGEKGRDVGTPLVVPTKSRIYIKQ